MKITFTRDCITDGGNRYVSPVMSVTDRRNMPRTKAVSDAIRTFEEHMKVNNWREVARHYVVS